METLTVAICDDEPIARELLTGMVASSPIPCACVTFPDGDSLLSSFRPYLYDLILLDIYMSGKDGVAVAERLRELDPTVPIAFATSSSEHALEGYRLHVDRYIRKPFSVAEIHEAIELAETRRREAPGIEISVAGEKTHVAFGRISTIEQRNRSLVYRLSNSEELRCVGRLDQVEPLLPSPPFFRCHQSYLVNLAHVVELDRELNVFRMDEGGTAYIRRESVRAAAAALARMRAAD